MRGCPAGGLERIETGRIIVRQAEEALELAEGRLKPGSAIP